MKSWTSFQQGMKHYFNRSEPVRKSDPIKTLLFVSYDPRHLQTQYQVGFHSLFDSAIPNLVLSLAALWDQSSWCSSLHLFSGCLGYISHWLLLMAGNWGSHNTFTNHYLRDIFQQEGDLLKLGPIVASQKVVVHTSAHWFCVLCCF